MSSGIGNNNTDDTPIGVSSIQHPTLVKQLEILRIFLKNILDKLSYNSSYNIEKDYKICSNCFGVNKSILDAIKCCEDEKIIRHNYFCFKCFTNYSYRSQALMCCS